MLSHQNIYSCIHIITFKLFYTYVFKSKKDIPVGKIAEKTVCWSEFLTTALSFASAELICPLGLG